MSNQKQFFAGLPTDIDVTELMDKIGVPKVGTLISYDRVAEIIKTPKTSNRFKTVTNRWRRLLFSNHNLSTKAVANDGFMVRSATERIEYASGQFDGAWRKIKVGANVAAKTNRAELTAEEARTADYLVKTASTIQLAARTQARQLQYPESE